MTPSRQRILIVGGVAGGASCATRARRLSETTEIIILEPGSFVSFASCGLPYYVGDVIQDEKDLLVANPELFQQRFNIEVRLGNEVLAIDRTAQQITVKNHQTGEVSQESYDALVLSLSATPIRPPLPGIDLPGIFALQTIPDSRMIRQWIREHQVKEAVVVGNGCLALGMVENLVRRGIAVTMIEAQSQIMAPLDPEMVAPIQKRLRSNQVQLVLEDGVAKFALNDQGGITVSTESGIDYFANLVILALGIQPETNLAQAAGLEIGDRGSIRVNEQMQTSDPNIWAVGDTVQVQDFVTGNWTYLPLSSPAHRQGRISADVIYGRNSMFRGVQGTIECDVFGMTIAATGVSEKMLHHLGWDYDKVYLHPGQPVAYSPKTKPIHLKLLFSNLDGRILGAQAIGEAGAEKCIDVIAMALQTGATVFDLEEAELCNATQVGTAKDPINMAGMIAANALRGDAPLVHWSQLADLNDRLLLDVRNENEFAAGHVAGALNIPLPELRNRRHELDPNQEIWVYCQGGQRAYYATRALRLYGFNVYNLSGGFNTYKDFT